MLTRVRRRPISLPMRDIANAFGRFRPALRGQRAQILKAIAATATVTTMALLRPWPVTWMIDYIVGRGGVDLVLWHVGAFAAVSFLVPILAGLATEQQQLAVARVSRKATVRIRADLFEHLQRIPMSRHSALYSGDVQVRLMGDVNMVRDLLFPSWLNLFSRASLIVVGAAVFIWVDWRLFLVALIPLPLLWVTVDRGSRAVKRAASKQRRKEGAISARANENLRRVGLIKAFVAEDRAIDAFRDQTRSAERATMAAARESARMARLAEVLTGAGVALVLVMGAIRVRAEALTVGELVLAMSYTRMLYKPLRKLTTEGARLAKALASAQRVIEILDLPVEDRASGVPVGRITADVRFENVSHTYPDGRTSVNGLTMVLPTGKTTAIVGENGTGKSTVLALLLRLYEPAAGSITAGGFPISSIQLETYRNNIAYVPQELALFGGTIRDNIRFGNPAGTEEALWRAVDAAHLRPVLDQLPDGIDTELDEDGASLSGGQARRVMLARAAFRDAPILLLDEPLSGLDVEARARVAEAIRSVAATRTTVIVHHGDLGPLRPDHVVTLDPSADTGSEDAHGWRLTGTAPGRTAPGRTAPGPRPSPIRAGALPVVP